MMRALHEVYEIRFAFLILAALESAIEGNFYECILSVCYTKLFEISMKEQGLTILKVTRGKSMIIFDAFNNR